MATTTHDHTVKRIDSRHSPRGPMGQRYLAAGKRLSMRLWEEEPGPSKPPTSRQYETVGFVIAGKAELEIEGSKLTLEEGDSWVVPAGADHSYTIVEPLRAVEATAPPAEVHGRDD